MRDGTGVRRAPVVVGRAVELEQLQRAVRGARLSPAQSMFVLGEAGVGKTRLLGEAVTTARRLGLGVLSGAASITTPVAFGVVSEALRSWLRAHPAGALASPFDRGLRLVLPEWDVSDEAAPELSAAQLRLLALEAIVQVVREIAAEYGAAIVLLDDLHGADAESLEAVRYLASARIDGAVVIGAMRPGESELADELARALRAGGVAEIIELAPLDQRGVSDLIAAVLGAAPPGPLVDDVLARTDGVPLLVEEVLAAHVRAGSVRDEAGSFVWRGGAFAVPKTIREMVEGRTLRLTRAQREVLVAAAVAGSFEPALLAAVAREDARTVGDALSAGIDVGLLETTGGSVAFRHAIIRDAVLDATAPHQRDAMHRRAAAALEAEDATDAHLLERRASHLATVGAGDEAAALLVAASRARLAGNMLLEAERLAVDAHAVAAAPSLRAEANDARATALAAQGRWSDALDVDEVTVAEHGDTPDRRQRMAMSALEAGRPEMARGIIDRALAAGDDSSPILITAGRAAIVEGDASSALEIAAQILDREADGDIDSFLHALDLQGRAFDYLGDRAAADAAWTRQAETALRAGRTQAQLRAVVMLGKIDLFAGGELTRLRAAVDIARDAGALVELAWAEENYAVGLGLRGDILGAEAVLVEAIARCEELHLDQVTYLLCGRAINTSFFSDDFEKYFDEAERIAPSPDLRLHAVSMRGDIALRRGEYNEAVQRFEESLELMKAMPGVVPMDSPCWLVWALVAAGRRDDAARLLEEVRALPDLARWHTRPVIVAAADALLAGDEAGIDAAIASATGHMPLDIALLRLLGAEIMKGPERARWLREALDIYEACGATVAADRARRLLRDAGGRVPRRARARASVPDELVRQGVSAREFEVLQLVDEGLSNAEIAQRLYISVRTVETHVSSLLTKLGARTRAQLAARNRTGSR